MATREDTTVEVKDDRDFPFAMVDRKLMQCPTVRWDEKLVYALLCTYANVRSGDCFPSFNTIAANLGISRNTVKKAIKNLEANGIIAIQHRRDDKQSHESNLYILKDWRSNNIPRPPDGLALGHDVTQPRPPDDSPLGHQMAPNDNHIELDPINDNQVSSFAESQKKPQGAKPAKPTTEKPKREPMTLEQVVKSYGEDSPQRCLKEIEREYKDLIPYYPTQINHAAPIVQRYGWQTVFECWKFKSKQKNGCWIDLYLVAKDIADYVAGRLPGQKGQPNGRVRSGSSKTQHLPALDGDNTDYYAKTSAVADYGEEWRKKNLAPVGT